MTDLNKERELYNQSFEKYWDDFCEAYGNGFDRSLAKLFFANAWGEAKAQAVPDNHIVVPKEPTKEMLKAGIHSYLHQDSIKEKDGSTSINFKYIYQEMIGASESGAEG